MGLLLQSRAEQAGIRQHSSSSLIVQVEVCKEQVDWATREKRTFLRQRIEARLANLYLGAKDYTAALALISRLLTEVCPGCVLSAHACWGRP